MTLQHQLGHAQTGTLSSAQDGHAFVDIFASEKELSKDIGFDYEAMLKNLREKETVRDVKDAILADYIKDINPDDRMQVLETLESALQYEKTRGDMKEYVLEKLLDLFED